MWGIMGWMTAVVTDNVVNMNASLPSETPPPSVAPHLHTTAGFLVIQQQLHGPHHLLADGVQQGIADVDAEAQQEFDDFQVLVFDGDQQSSAAEGVDAVDVDLEVDLCFLGNNENVIGRQGVCILTFIIGLNQH